MTRIRDRAITCAPRRSRFRESDGTLARQPEQNQNRWLDLASFSRLPVPRKKRFTAALRGCWNSRDSAEAERRCSEGAPAGWNGSNRSLEKSGAGRVCVTSARPAESSKVGLEDWLLKSVPTSSIPRIQAASAGAIFIITHSAQSPIGIPSDRAFTPANSYETAPACGGE